jgi:probable rRNA maturation factor
MGEPPSPSPDANGITIVVSDEQDDVEIDADRWAALAEHVLRAEGREGELTLTFVDTAIMTELNVEHMGERYATDVLSFPLDADLTPAHVPSEWGPLLLGDVVVCPAVAAANAPTHAGTLDDELALLVVHGILHVLGHDHSEPDETATMRGRELEHLTAHHWHGPAPADFRQDQP